MRKTWLLLVVAGIAASSARGQTTGASDDAATIYVSAAKIIRNDDQKNIMSPASSSMVYPDYPPMPDAWVQMEKQDYDLHGRVRAMVRVSTES